MMSTFFTPVLHVARSEAAHAPGQAAPLHASIATHTHRTNRLFDCRFVILPIASGHAYGDPQTFVIPTLSLQSSRIRRTSDSPQQSDTIFRVPDYVTDLLRGRSGRHQPASA